MGNVCCVCMVACFLAVAQPGAAQGKPGEAERPRPARGTPAPDTEAKKTASQSLLETVLSLLVLPRDVLVAVMRGDEPSQIGNIVVGRLGKRGFMERAHTERRDLRSPLFDPQTGGIIALSADTLVLVSPAGKVTELGAPAELPLHTVVLLLGWERKYHQLAMLLNDGSVRLLDLKTLKVADSGVDSIGDGKLGNEEIRRLIDASRTCKGKTLEVRDLPARGAKRRDVGVRPAQSSEWTNLTGDRSSHNHSDPAFAPQCGQIAFVATD